MIPMEMLVSKTRTLRYGPNVASLPCGATLELGLLYSRSLALTQMYGVKKMMLSLYWARVFATGLFVLQIMGSSHCTHCPMASVAGRANLSVCCHHALIHLTRKCMELMCV